MAKKKSSISEEDLAVFDAALAIGAQWLGISKSEFIEEFDRWLKRALRLAGPVAKELGVSKYVVGDLWVAMRLASERLLTADELSTVQTRGGISALEVRRVYRELRRRPIPFLSISSGSSE